MTINFKVVIIIILIFVQSSLEKRSGSKSQNVVVTGVLKCNSRPYEGARVFLVYSLNIIRNYRFTLSIKGSDAEGWFFIKGKRANRYPVPFYVKIYHQCKEVVYNMCREVTIRVPRSYVFRNWENPKKYDLRNLELSTTQYRRIPCFRAE